MSPTIDRDYRVNDVDISLRCFHTGPSQLVSHLILTGETYAVPPIEQLVTAGAAPVIVDIGANIGASSVWFAANYPSAVIHAVEPSPDCLPLLTHNLQPWPHTQIHPIGLGDHDHTAPLYHGVKDPVTGSLIPSALTAESSVPVTVRGASDWLNETGIDHIDVLKLDTEGSEVPILSHLIASHAAMVADISLLHLEFHSETDRRRLDDLLQPTHSLTAGTVFDSHRGEVTYSSRRFLERTGDPDGQRIALDP